MNRQKGVLLIEVMVSLVIFSVGILALVALQAQATKSSLDAEDRNRAAVLANEAISLLWTNATVNLPPDVLLLWQQRVAGSVPGAAGTNQGLPSGIGTITTDTTVTPVVTTISVVWQEPSRATRSQYVTQVTLN